MTEAGLYVTPNLIPGNYTVKRAAKGFKRKKVSDVKLAVDRQVRVDVMLD